MTFTRIKKAVQQLDKDGKVINEFESIYSASKATGIHFGLIHRCAVTGYKCHDYKWKLKTDNDGQKEVQTRDSKGRFGPKVKK